MLPHCMAPTIVQTDMFAKAAVPDKTAIEYNSSPLRDDPTIAPPAGGNQNTKEKKKPTGHVSVRYLFGQLLSSFAETCLKCQQCRRKLKKEHELFTDGESPADHYWFDITFNPKKGMRPACVGCLELNRKLDPSKACPDCKFGHLLPLWSRSAAAYECYICHERTDVFDNSVRS